MHRAIRTQVDDLGDEYSRISSIDFTESKDMARQEFKKETDIKYILRRFGATGAIQQRMNGEYGKEIDYNMDLQQAFSAVDAAQTAWRRMPQELRDAYPTHVELIAAIESGEYGKQLESWTKRKRAENKEEAKKTASEKAVDKPKDEKPA